MKIESYTKPLRDALTQPESLRPAIEHFLAAYWPVERPQEIGEQAWDILGDLATDLEYYEPNPQVSFESWRY